MTTFEQEAFDTIARIMNDLRDRYQSGFPIIKEIIQNADDSNSERLDFGWTKGLLNAHHPLLKGPSLFFINNGQFKRSDAQAIRRFGNSEKNGQQMAIGKFGLGQKSIFHLCEAFFYLAHSPNEKFDPRFPACNLLNPWAKANPQPNELADPYHPDWKEFSEADQKCVKDHCQEILGQENYKQHFFILWIPLRKESRQKIKKLDGQEVEVGVIMNTFPGDQETPPNEIFPANLASEIGILLPLLRSLETVSYWLPNHNAKLQAQFQLTLQGSRRHYTPQHAEEKPHEISGNVQITHFDHEDKNSLVFSGYEAILNNRTLTNIREHKLWPTSLRMDSETGQSSQEPDKAFAHSAVTVIQTPASQKSHLSIQWAVFLPLGEPDEFPNEKIPYEGNKDYVVLLHGYFFVDAGRQYIEGKNKNTTSELTDNSTEAEVRQKWNQQLTTKGTLKNVLPALNQFVEKHQPNYEEIWSLSDALKKSQFFQKYQDDICQESQWVYIVDKQEWQLIDAQQSLLAIPQPDKDKTKTLPWEVLPNLQAIEDHLITLIDAPNLTTLASNWLENQLETVLQNVPGHVVFQKEEQLAYLLDFINQCVLHSTSILSEILKTQLCHIAKQAFANIKANELYQFKERVTEFLNFISEKCFFIECETYHAELFFELNQLNKTQILLIPKYKNKNKTKENDFDFSPVKSEQKLSRSDAEVILVQLESIIEDEKSQKIVKDYADIAWKILRFVADKKSFVETHPDLRVLRAHNCRYSQKDESTIVPLNEISRAFKEGTLFRHKKDMQNRREFANPLQRVLADATVILLEKDVADLLSDLFEIVRCDAAGCLIALSHGPVLNPSINERVELLNKLSLGTHLENDSAFTKGIRYLLTLKLEYDLEDKSPLWYLTSSEDKRFVKPILTACGKQEYLIDDAFVPNVVDELGSTKQKLISIEEITPEMVIVEALNYAKPHELWESILDALQDVDIGSFSETQKLRQTAWLLDKTGELIKPEEVVYLPEIQNTVSRIIGEQTEFCYWDYLRLDVEIRTHSSFPKLCDAKTIFASGSQGLKILGLFLMEQDEKYRLGQFTHKTFKLDECNEVFKNIPAKLLPTWEIIKIANEKYPNEVLSLLEQLFGQLSSNRLKELLLWLKTRNPLTLKIMEVFNSYLKTAVTHPQFDDIFPEIYFLSKTRQWKLPSQLVNDAQVGDDYLLLPEQADILKDYLEKYSPQSTSSEENPTQQTLKLGEYFREWEGRIINDEMIGVFFALLGDNPVVGDGTEIRQLAKNYLKHYGVNDIRTELTGASWIDEVDNHWSNFEIAIHRTQNSDSDNKVQLTALDGSQILVSLSQQAQSIIISCKPVKVEGNKRLIKMQLRIIDIHQYQSANLSEVLKNSIETLLESIHQLKNDANNQQENIYDLDKLWNELSKTEQFDIDIARQMMLDDVLSYLRLLRLPNRTSQINSILTDWDKIRRHQKKLGKKELAKTEKEYFKKQYLEQRQAKIDDLGEIIKDDPQAQTDIFKAVKAIIQKYQYTPVCIPFELFQNADDAVVELEELNDTTEKSKHLILIWDKSHLTIVHFGRKINHFRSPYFPEPKGEERGFDRDLEKMLVLSLSDKTGPVTGKFGFGFKSVFLICQQPQILSGKLAFKIVAGMLPETLSYEEKQNLSAYLKAQYDEALAGTVIHLPLEDEFKNKANHVVTDFTKVAGILLAFAKRIKHCTLVSPHKSSELSWQPTKIINDVYLGEIKLGVEPEIKSKALLIGNQELGAILIALDTTGFCQFPHYDEIPDIWVTAPLQESNKLVFAINGPFQIDVGRSRLASHSEKNQQIAQNLGILIGRKLCELFALAQQSDFSLQEKFGLASDISSYEFWDSVWHILAESWLDIDNPLIHKMLGNLNTVGQLIKQYPTFPNGLWGKYRVLTDVKSIVYVASGILNDENHFKKISIWSRFQQEIRPEQIASERKWKQLEKLCPELVKNINYQPFDLADAVEREFFGVRKEVSPELAQQLGQLINREFLKELKYKQKEQHQKLLEVLKQARFKAKDDQYHSVNQLLCEMAQTSDDEESANDLLGEIELTYHEKHEECYRADFAPDENVLASEYSEQAVAFFKACRQQMKKLDLIQWALRPKNDDQKKAILFYLRNGKKGEEIAKAFRAKTSSKTKTSDWWWTNLEPTDELFERLENKQQKIAVLFKLKQSELFDQFRKKYEDEEQKALNKKIGENVEKIIEKILRDKGLNVKNIHKGGDLHIWTKEDISWDISQMEIDRRNLFFTMEIKFTTGSRAHLSSLQSETARKKESQYVVLVVGGNPELKEQLNIDIDENAISDELKTAIIDNSHVVEKLHEKLGELPNPDDITPDLQGYWLKKPLWGKNKNIEQWVTDNFIKSDEQT